MSKLNDLKFSKDAFEPAVDFNDAEAISRAPVKYWTDVWRRLKKNKLAMFGLVIIIILALFAIFAPILSKFDFRTMDIKIQNRWPSMEHFFGTDEFGRDMFTRIWYGARISLFIGVMAATFDVFVGVFFGGIAGYLGGRVDNIMMRVSEVLYSIPFMLMVILLMMLLSPGIWTMILAMSITGWVPMARLVRGQVLQLKEQEFVQAAKLFGANIGWILVKHLIPNVMAFIIVNATMTIPRAIFTEATLSYLGLGVQSPMASWGTMASDGIGLFKLGYEYQLVFPALFISLTMFSFNVLGDGLRDALDPKLRK